MGNLFFFGIFQIRSVRHPGPRSATTHITQGTTFVYKHLCCKTSFSLGSAPTKSIRFGTKYIEYKHRGENCSLSLESLVHVRGSICCRTRHKEYRFQWEDLSSFCGTPLNSIDFPWEADFIIVQRHQPWGIPGGYLEKPIIHTKLIRDRSFRMNCFFECSLSRNSDIHGCYYLLSFRTIVVVSPLQPWPCVRTSRCKGGLWQCDFRYIPIQYRGMIWLQTNIKKPWVVHLGSSWFIFRNWTGIFYLEQLMVYSMYNVFSIPEDAPKWPTISILNSVYVCVVSYV